MSSGKWLEYLKSRRTDIVRAVLFGLFPIVCAGIYCLKEGITFSEVFLPASYWNDELMYFKQVEGMVNYGLPQGWFGFNEAHGNVYPFAAWSPVILLPWVLWGKLFGWNLAAPVCANIFFLSAGMVVFAVTAKPALKQSAALLGLLGLFVPYTRYMLSGMPETLCMSLVLCFAGLVLAQLRRESTGRLVWMYAIVIFLTLSRPYLGMLFLAPVWFTLRKLHKKGILISIAVTAATAVCYGAVMHLCCSPYIEPIVETEWLGIFGTEGFAAGVQYTAGKLADRFYRLFTYYLNWGVRYGLFAGALYAMLGAVAVLLGGRALWAWKTGRDNDKGKELRLVCLFQFLISVGMIFALFLCYRMGEGSKHLLPFIVMGMVWIAMLEEKYYALKLVTAVLCIYFFIVKALAPYDWQVAYDDDVRAEAEDLQIQLQERMSLTEGTNRYDNTVIWLASDIINGEGIPASWGLLYMVPEGFGINFCTQVYVMEHIDELQSRYIALVPGGEVETALAERGAVMLAETENMRLYQLY